MSTREVQDLVEQLQQARDAYYGDSPIMSDAEFDALEDQLRDLDPENAYFKAVGAKPKSGWSKVRHGAPMGSLLKVQVEQELAEWHTDVSAKIRAAHVSGDVGSADPGIVISEKLDGISISLRYENGQLVQALTRGDGEMGEDITRNVLLMKGVQRKMRDFTGFVRGEIVLLRSDHRKHVPEYKNPRNAASGIAKRESDPAPCKHLTVICYQVITDAHGIVRKSVELKLLEKLGCITPNWSTASTVDDVLSVYREYVSKTREGLDYEIDGLVVELDDLSAMEHLGEHDGRPKGARAFKFPHEKQPTKLREIVWQVGASGRVTPVAYFDAVNLAGASVSQASLHNESNIRRLAEKCPQNLLGMSDTVLVSRRNDVIPYVEQVLRPSQNGRFAIPRDCPSCGKPLSKKGEFLVCDDGARCPAQQSGAVKRWVKKLDVKEWGDTAIEALCASGKVRSLADIYRLTVTDLEDFQLSGKRIGTSTAERMLENLSAKKTLRIADFVGALGIDLCGQTVCQMIVDAGFDTLEKMGKASLAALAAIPGLGETKAGAFVDGFRGCRKLVEDLLAAGVSVKGPVKGKLSGKSFCFTGIRDKGMEDRIKDAGGAIKTSVGKDLTYLVAKDPTSASGKAKKARDYGVQVIGVADVEAML
jgi:DNA ligase (NAD+)